jgi:hypothetical protein
MAFPGLLRAATAPPLVGGSFPTPPARAYARSIGNAEKGLGTTPDDMQSTSGLRNRQPRAPSPTELDRRQDFTDTSGTLTPSTNDNADEQGNRY